MMIREDRYALTKNAKKILIEIVKGNGSMRYSELKSRLKMADGTLIHNLNRLIETSIIEKIDGTGLYKLTKSTPWLFFSKNEKILSELLVYIGLLGKVREEVEEPVYRTAVDLLSRKSSGYSIIRESGLGAKPKYIYILTSEEAKNSWIGLDDVDQWILLPEEELWDIDKVKIRLLKTLELLMKNYAVILDSTGDGKPPALAFYEVANEELIPLIYVHRLPTGRKLRWLISIRDIADRLGITNLLDGGERYGG